MGGDVLIIVLAGRVMIHDRAGPAPPRRLPACPPARLPACPPTCPPLILLHSFSPHLTLPLFAIHDPTHSLSSTTTPAPIQPAHPSHSLRRRTSHHTRYLKPGNKCNHAPGPHTHRRARANAVRNSTEREIDETTKNKKRKTSRKKGKRKRKKEKGKKDKGKRKKKKGKGKRKKKKEKGKKHTYIAPGLV